MLERKSVLELGSPEPIRDFLYVSDLVNACIKLTESPSADSGQIINLSTSKATSVKELADRISHTKFKNKINWNSNSILSRPGDPKWLVADTKKVKNDINIPAIENDFIQ